MENETSSTGRTLLFNDLDDAEMSVVSDVLLPKLYGPGEVIYREGGHGGSLNIIGKGKVRIQKMSDSGGQFCIATLKEGDVFGFMSFIDGGEHNATIISDQQTELIVLRRPDFDRLAVDHPLIASKILQRVAAHLASIVRGMNSQYLDVMHLMFGRARQNVKGAPGAC